MSREFLDAIYGYLEHVNRLIATLKEQIARTKKNPHEVEILKAELYCRQSERERLDNLITVYCESFK